VGGYKISEIYYLHCILKFIALGFLVIKQYLYNLVAFIYLIDKKKTSKCDLFREEKYCQLEGTKNLLYEQQ